MILYLSVERKHVHYSFHCCCKPVVAEAKLNQVLCWGNVNMTFVSVVLFLVGTTWFIEIGGLEKEQLQYLNESLAFNRTEQFNATEYLGHHVVRFKVDIPSSEKVPPVAGVVPLLDVLSIMGFTLVSHNDESRPHKDMVYLTWILQKEHSSLSTITALNEED